MEPYRRYWDDNLDRLDAHLRRLQQNEPVHHTDRKTT